LLIVVSMISFKVLGQCICDPILVINKSYLDKFFDARFDDCFDNSSIVLATDNPLIRAKIIKKYKIKTIKKIRYFGFGYYWSDSVIIEHFDNNGYITKINEFNNENKKDSIFFNNRFNSSLLLISTESIRKSIEKRSFIGKIFMRSNLEFYDYDDRNNLIKYIEIFKNVNHKIFRRNERIQRFYKYDSINNLIEILGCQRYKYNSENKILLAEDLGNYENRQIKKFYYDSLENLTLIRYCHVDSSTFKNYNKTFKYDSLNRVSEIVKYHGDGRFWTIQKFEYLNDLLSLESETMYSGTSNDSYTTTKKYFYENGLICRTEEYYSNETIKLRKNIEMLYEYKFY